jgi:sulfofructosephosphate aldolase
MSDTERNLEHQLAPLRTAEGGFAMVALDQRESLRAMFPRVDGGELVGDVTLREFKELASSILTPFASGVLLDRPLAITAARPPSFVAPSCGLVLAADVLHGGRGMGVTGSSLDAAVTPEFIRATAASAIKFLVIWRRGIDNERRDTLKRFLELAAAAGVASFVEGIVRPPQGAEWKSDADRHDAILEAAAELSVGASVYKAEVPGYIPGDLALVQEQAALVTEIVAGPWVILSNGIDRRDFAQAVARSTAGGASGFLAGRAIWADTVSEDDIPAALSSKSVKRLMELSEIVKRSLLNVAGRAASHE